MRPAWPEPSSDYGSETIEVVADFDSDKVSFGAPILRHTVSCLINGMHQGTDNGKGTFNQPKDSALLIMWIDYEKGEIQYRPNGLEREDRVCFIASVESESLYTEEHDTSLLFNCKCCGARQQKGRCFYCKSFPNVKEK